MRHPQLQELVVNVLPVGGEDRTSGDEPPQDRQSGLQNGQAEGNHRDRHRDDGRCLLSTLQREGAQQKPDELAPAITQEDGCGVEVESEKAEDPTRQRDRHQGHQRGVAQERHHKDN